MVWPCTTGHVLIKSITHFLFLALKRKEDLGRHSLNVWRLMCGLADVDPKDRDARRAGVRHSLVLWTPCSGTRAALKWIWMDGLMDNCEKNTPVIIQENAVTIHVFFIEETHLKLSSAKCLRPISFTMPDWPARITHTRGANMSLNKPAFWDASLE